MEFRDAEVFAACATPELIAQLERVRERKARIVNREEGREPLWSALERTETLLSAELRQRMNHGGPA